MSRPKSVTPLYTVEQIAEHFGGPIALAKTLNCTVNNIRMWNGFVPEGRAYEIQFKSGGFFLVDRMPIKRREAAPAT